MTRQNVMNRFDKNQDFKPMITFIQKHPNLYTENFRNKVIRMHKVFEGANTTTDSKMMYKKVQNLVQSIRARNGRNKAPARESLRVLIGQQPQRWATMKRNMKYNTTPNVRETINAAELEAGPQRTRVLAGLSHGVRAMLRRSPANIASRLANLKRRYNVARTQTNRNTIKAEMNELKEAQKILVNTKSQGVQTPVSTPTPTQNFNANMNKALDIEDRLERLRALQQLLRKYPSQKAKIQSEIIQVIRKMYRSPPVGAKNENIRFDIAQAKRLVGGSTRNINRELEYALTRKAATTTSSSTANTLKKLLEQRSSGSSLGNLLRPSVPVQMPVMAPVAPVPMIAPPPSVIQALPQPERVALNAAGGYTRAARIVNNIGGPQVTERAIRILERNKGNVNAAVKNSGLPPRVFVDIKKLGGPVRARRTIAAVKKVKPKVLTMRAAAATAKATSKATTKATSKATSKATAKAKAKAKAKPKKQGVSSRVSQKKKLQTLISQIPRKNLEKNVLACVLP